MTDLDAIRADLPSGDTTRALTHQWADAGRHVPALIAEVERLRTELVDERAAHAKTCSNFEEWAEANAEAWKDSRAELIVERDVALGWYAEVERLQNEVRVLTGTEDANLAIVQAENQRLRDVVDKARQLLVALQRTQIHWPRQTGKTLLLNSVNDLAAAVDALDGGGE